MKAAFLFSLLTLAAASAMAQGTPAALKCMFKGGLDLHASPDASSRIVSKVQCGSPVFIIDKSHYAPRVRTSDGTEGYFIGLNFGQWWVEPETTTYSNPDNVTYTIKIDPAAGSLAGSLPTPPFAPPPKVEAAPPPPPPAPRAVQPEPIPSVAMSNAPARAEDGLRHNPAVPNILADSGSFRIQPGDRIFIPRMDGALHAYLAAELVKKLPVMVVQEESVADFVLSSAPRTSDGQWFNSLFEKRGESNVQLFYIRSHTLVWSAETGDRSVWWDTLSHGDARQVAGRIVDKLKRDLFKN
jgi:hypothetical protein